MALGGTPLPTRYGNPINDRFPPVSSLTVRSGSCDCRMEQVGQLIPFRGKMFSTALFPNLRKFEVGCSGEGGCSKRLKEGFCKASGSFKSLYLLLPSAMLLPHSKTIPPTIVADSTTRKVRARRQQAKVMNPAIIASKEHR